MMRGKDDPTRLSYWFPKIEAAGLPVPRTRVIPIDGGISSEPTGDAKLDRQFQLNLTRLRSEIQAAALDLGTPLFLRTDFTSHKHDWQKTCFLTDTSPGTIVKHVRAIAEFSECADFMGLPTDVWVVREILKTTPLFTAFHGRMPITREFRFFVKDGAIEHEQPYWPPAAIEDHNPDNPNWRDLLADASTVRLHEHELLKELSLRAGEAVGGGFWSIDWLQTADRGWVLTDMAEGSQSYRWDPSDARKAEA